MARGSFKPPLHTPSLLVSPLFPPGFRPSVGPPNGIPRRRCPLLSHFPFQNKVRNLRMYNIFLPLLRLLLLFTTKPPPPRGSCPNDSSPPSNRTRWEGLVDLPHAPGPRPPPVDESPRVLPLRVADEGNESLHPPFLFSTLTPTSPSTTPDFVLPSHPLICGTPSFMPHRRTGVTSGCGPLTGT